MDSHQRRQLRRIEERLRSDLGLGASRTQPAESKPEASQANWFRRIFERPITKTIAIVGFVASLLSLFALRPQLTLEPDLVLNPVDPFSTQFSVQNLNLILDAKDLNPTCRTIYVMTSHNVGLVGLPPRPSPAIPRLHPQRKTTIMCPPWLGNLGAGAGDVLVAYIEIDLSYRQIMPVRERFPFKGAIDSQRGVHWTHITPEQLETELSTRKP